MLSDPRAYYASAQSVLDAYRAGDELTMSRRHDDPMVADRNAGWLPKIELEIDKGNAFIAFGAAHLFTSTGILEKLKADGYSVVDATTD
jgi:uncharacterized protein YbaP (TraB family)